MKLPSPKASLLILIIIFIATSLMVFGDYKKEAPEEVVVEQGDIIISQIQKDTINIDSDNDGLYDWEEVFWGTNPTNPDSDGDGVNDKQEIDSNRDPLKSGNDQLTSIEEKALSKIKDNQIADDSITNKVALTFAESYFKLRNSGELDEYQKEQLIENLTEEAIKNIEIDSVYSLNSLKTFANDDEKLIKYADEFLATQVWILNEVVKNYENPNYTQLGDFMILKSGQLTLLEVPFEIRSQHLYISNKYYQFGKVIKEFEKEDKDPLYVMLLLNIYQNIENEIQKTSEQIGLFLKESGIIIEENEIKIDENV